jgi:hypothetical protein
LKIRVWKEGMSDAETKDLAYWERNVLALYCASGWYNDDVKRDRIAGTTDPRIEGAADSIPRYKGWRRVLSIHGGTITFHIPDDFDVGDLPEIEPNWDGHTSEDKWRRILQARKVKIDSDKVATIGVKCGGIGTEDRYVLIASGGGHLPAMQGAELNATQARTVRDYLCALLGTPTKEDIDRLG